MKRHAILACLGVMLCCTACGGGKADQPVPVQEPLISGLPQLPAPAGLQRQPSEPLDYSGHWQPGSSPGGILPAHNVFDGLFSPLYDPPEDLLNPAWNSYSFPDAPVLSEGLIVHLNWFDPAPDPAEIYVAVANHGGNRWDWQHYSAAGNDFGGPEGLYTTDGHVDVVVALTGTQPAILNSVVLGEPPPYLFIKTDLNTDPLLNTGPRTVNFNCSNSEQLVHTIAGFDFDFDGDGSYEVTGNTDGQASHLYENGNYTAVVRIHDTAGNSDTDSLSFAIIDPANSGPVASFSSDVISGVSPLTVTFDASLSSDSDGYIAEYRWDFTDDGVADVVTTEPDGVQWTFHQFGFNTVELTVVDNYLAENFISAPIELTKGWRRAVIESDVLLKGEFALTTVGNGLNTRPAVAFLDAEGNDLVFRLASNSEGSAWEPRRYPVGLEDRFSSSPHVRMDSYDGELRIAYDIHNPLEDRSEIHWVKSFTDTGELWQASVMVSDAENVILSGLGRVDDLPYIAAVRNKNVFGEPQSVLVYPASENAADGWENASTALALPLGTAVLSLSPHRWDTSLGGNGPALLVDTYGSSVQTQYLLRSTNLFLGSWLEPVESSSRFATGVSLYSISGLPVTVLGSSFDGPLLVQQCGNSDGTDWTAAPLEVAGSAGLNPILDRSIASYSIGYYDTARDAIACVLSDGSGVSAWHAPDFIAYGSQLRNDPKLVYSDFRRVLVYYDTENHQLISSWFE
ncbi:PKD domain-containing protein [bacterium]|nr:PKD domain-containing protein [bacterium]